MNSQIMWRQARFAPALNAVLNNFDVDSAIKLSDLIHEAESDGYQLTHHEEEKWSKLTELIEQATGLEEDTFDPALNPVDCDCRKYPHVHLNEYIVFGWHTIHLLRQSLMAKWSFGAKDAWLPDDVVVDILQDTVKGGMSRDDEGPEFPRAA